MRDSQGQGDGDRRGRALAIVPEMPVPPFTGGRIRTRKLLEALAGEFRVTVAGFGDPGDAAALEGVLHDVVAVPWTPSALYAEMKSEDPAVARRAFEALAHPDADPWIVTCYESEALRSAIACRASVRHDLVLVEHSLMARYLDVAPTAPVVLDLHNVHAALADRDASKSDDRDEVRRIQRFERTAIGRSDVTLAVSEVDARHAEALAPGAHLRIVPNGVDTLHFTPASAGEGRAESLLFTGLMNYAPNVAAVEWFTREVLPLIPQCTLKIVGANPEERVSRLACARVIVQGEVPDMRPHYAEAGIVVVPLLGGGGTRLKILEAAACGKAIVSTSVGVEGLELRDGRDLLIADDPKAFADALRRLISDPRLRADLGRQARRAVAAYDWARIQARFLEAIASLVPVG